MRFILIYLAVLTLVLQAAVGHVAALKGDAVIERKGKTLKVAIGSAIEEKDLIKTRAGTRAQLLFTDETVINLGPSTEFGVEEFFYHEQAAAPKAKFTATKGAFKAITGQVGKLAPENFSLQTRTATIGIRGTHFAGQLGENERFACIRGAISVTTPDGTSVLLRAGEMTEVIPGQPPAKPRKYVSGELDNGEGENGAQEEQGADEEGAQEEGAQEQAGAAEGGAGETETLETLAAFVPETISEAVNAAITQETSNLITNLLLQERFGSLELWMRRECDYSQNCTYSYYMGPARNTLLSPSGEIIQGDGYRYSINGNVETDVSFAAEDAASQFKINLFRVMEWSGSSVVITQGLSYGGLLTQASSLQANRVYGWNILASAWRECAVTGCGDYENSGIDPYVPELMDSGEEGSAMAAINTANKNFLLVHGDGLAIGSYGTASDGTVSIAFADHMFDLDEYNPYVQGTGSGALYGTQAQGLGGQGQFTYDGGGGDVKQDWIAAGFAPSGGDLSGATSGSGTLALTGYVSTAYEEGEIELSVNRGSGAVLANIEVGGGDADYAFSGNNAAQTAAYINDGFFGVVDSGTGLYNGSGYLVALPGGGNGDFVGWGYWNVTGTDGGDYDIANGLWVAGKDAALAATHITDKISSNSGSYTYNGHVMGSASEGGRILMNGQNSVQLVFNFSNGSITGNVGFQTADETAWSATVNETISGAVTGGNFLLSPSVDIAGYGEMQGSFYGTQAQAVGGTFLFDNQTDTASGVFKANR